VDGSGKDLGKPVLIDGFANGWLVTPPASGTMSISLVWTPQTAEDATLLVSALAAAACVLLAFVPARRRLRRRGRRSVAPTSDAAVAAGSGGAPVDTGTGTRWADLSAPDAAANPVEVASPFSTDRRASPLTTLIAAVASAFVAAVIVPPGAFPFVFVGIGGAVVLGLLAPRAGGVLRLGAVAAAAAAAIYVVVHQAMGHFNANGNWPSQFEAANVLVWVAVVLLGADAVVRVLRDRRR
jgi:hypothetical protein